jgi:hypothetical protein
MISLDLYRKYNLVFVRDITTLCHQFGVPVEIHHCGRSREIWEMLAGEEIPHWWRYA